MLKGVKIIRHLKIHFLLFHISTPFKQCVYWFGGMNELRHDFGDGVTRTIKNLINNEM